MKKEVIGEFVGDYAFLSNFYIHSFEWSGDRWATVEHAFQAAKMVEPLDYFKIRDARTPAMAKKLGRTCPMKEGWAEDRIGVMLQILKAKFTDKELREKLLATKDALLIEGNHWKDKFWGICLKSGEGQNQLGIALMLTREYYKHTKEK